MQASNFMQPMIDLPWSPEEHSLFLQGYLVYGKSWIEIAEVVRSRNAYQVCAYANWLESHGCLPRLPPIQHAASQMQNSQIQRAATRPSTATGAGTPYKKGTWSSEEHGLFLQALKTHGKDWKKIATVVTTRNNIQIASHAHTYFKSIGEQSGSAKKRKASDEQTPKAKKKQAATSKAILSPPRKVSKLPTSKGSAFNPVASTPKSAGKTKMEPIDDSVVDVKPPSMKKGNVGKKAVSTPVKKIDVETAKQDAINPTDSTPQVTNDQEEAVESRMKIPMIAVGVLATILLAGAAILYYMEVEEGEIPHTDEPSLEL